MGTDAKPRIAIIGCGAVTKRWHLPALAALGLKPALLVDRVLARAEALAAEVTGAQVAVESSAALPCFDAAILALPNHLHASATVELLQAGKHVLVEKPLARTVEEGEQIAAEATRSGHAVRVGLMRRYMPVMQWVHAAVAAGHLGRILRVDHREGNEPGWPYESDYFMRKELAGGGVLMDTGSHALDLLLWWLGDVSDFRYWDDAYTGVEMDCVMEVSFASGATGTVELSRTRKLRNSTIITGERGELEIGAYGQSLEARPRSLLRAAWHGFRGDRLPAHDPLRPYVGQLREWIAAMGGRGEAGAPDPEAGLRGLRWVHGCYARRQPLIFPWMEPAKFLADPAAWRMP